MEPQQYVIGLDFGTDSVRAVLVDSFDGKTLSSHVHAYKRWEKRLYCDPAKNQFRQHPLDHIEGMEQVIKTVLKNSNSSPHSIKGICIDTTGSSPVPVNKNGEALALHAPFKENANAMMVLWKDHTAIKEASEINDLAQNWGGINFTKYEGGIYSSEWFWSKVLHIIRNDKQVKESAHSWMEHCDYMTYLLVGNNNIEQFKRSRCAAGHKAMWHHSWGGLPDDLFLKKLDPHLVTIKDRMYINTYTSDTAAGTLNEEWSKKLGLSKDTIVSVGTFDAHAGAVGAEIKESTLVKVMGTSTCDIIVSSKEVIDNRLIKGICGQVDGSVLPEMIGLEAGQSAFGDVLAWFRDVLCWPLHNLNIEGLSNNQIDQLKDQIIPQLSKQAEELSIHENLPFALDWINGRRTPDANQALKAAILNLDLGSQAPHIFFALVEAICFGSKVIVDRFKREGVHIKTVLGIGGVAKKSKFIMQTLANVLNVPVQVANSEQTPALGAAMYASVAAGIHLNMQCAIDAMGQGVEVVYYPETRLVDIYKKRYQKYLLVGDFVEEKINTIT